MDKNCISLYVNILSISRRGRIMIYGECGEIVLFRDGKAVNKGGKTKCVKTV